MGAVRATHEHTYRHGRSLDGHTNKNNTHTDMFPALKNIWKKKKISKKTKIHIFKCNVLSALLHAPESWKYTKGICHMLELFQYKCLRRILHVFWPNILLNVELQE